MFYNMITSQVYREMITLLGLLIFTSEYGHGKQEVIFDGRTMKQPLGDFRQEDDDQIRYTTRYRLLKSIRYA